MIVANTLIYGFVSWLPTFFVQQGLSMVNSFKYSFLMTCGAPVGASIASVTADSLGRKPAIIGASLLAIAFGGVYPAVREPFMFSLMGFLLVVSIYILVALLFAIYIPELFPTDVRGRGGPGGGRRRAHAGGGVVQHAGTDGDDLHAISGGVSAAGTWSERRSGVNDWFADTADPGRAFLWNRVEEEAARRVGVRKKQTSLREARFERNCLTGSNSGLFGLGLERTTGPGSGRKRPDVQANATRQKSFAPSRLSVGNSTPSGRRSALHVSRPRLNRPRQLPR